MPSLKRRLAAIVFTDIVGFTNLSSKDEEGAYKLILKQREILKPIVLKHEGQWLKEEGDALLLSFPSTKEAVNCSIQIQEAVKDVDNLNLRIGIHQGDVIQEDKDVFGDDVNIASRIEPFAAPGGIAVSQKIQQALSSSPEFEFKFIDKPKLKGVQQEISVFCLISHGLPESKKSQVQAKVEPKKKGGKVDKKGWANGGTVTMPTVGKDTFMRTYKHGAVISPRPRPTVPHGSRMRGTGIAKRGW